MPRRDSFASKHIASFVQGLVAGNAAETSAAIIRTLQQSRQFEDSILSSMSAQRVSATRIVLYVESQSVASRLRFQLSEIRNLLKSKFMPRLQQVRVIVSHPVDETPSGSPRRRPRKASRQSSENVLSAARQINDEKLASALKRLATHMASA